MLTNQEAFDRAYVALKAQGARSMRCVNSESNVCAYRGSEDRKCGIGLFMTDVDAMWADAQPAPSYGNLCHRDPKLEKRVGVVLQFGIDLQNAHDKSYGAGAEFRAKLRANFRDLAVGYGLSTAVMDVDAPE